MENKPLISVIIPVYRVEDSLDTCLESVVHQDYENLQIILIDDGSPDKSGEICDFWATKDKRIEVIHKENGGLSSARNAGLEIVRGAYILFLDSDDFLDLTTCSQLYSIIEKNDADVAVCHQLDLFENASKEFVREGQVKVLDRETAIAEIWYQKVLPSAWGKLYKADLFHDLSFREGIYFEDVDIIYQLYWKSRRIAITTARLYGYVHHSGTITTGAFSSHNLDILSITDRINDFVSNKSQTIKDAARAYSCAVALRVFLNTPKNKEFIEDINKAKATLKQEGRTVLKDKNIKNKLKIALILYLYFRPFISLVYQFVDRWK